jgi:microsomal dipeptidase-like Zn-dependent dipeptidase
MKRNPIFPMVLLAALLGAAYGEAVSAERLPRVPARPVPAPLPVPAPASAPAAAPATDDAPLWGWADLHAHPASHMSFGADRQKGQTGIFWGRPGLKLETSDAADDMPPCSPDKHGGFDEDVVRHKTHQTVIATIDNITGYTHEANGGPSFANWPNARSLTHQQMHITSLRRAYDGGQRLLVASVTDNEFLSALWSKIGYNAAGNQVPLHDPKQNYASALRQLVFIKQLVGANPGWMEVAYSAADARRIVAANKLAVILSLEMDSLTPSQTLELVRREGVRHVVPIHLINNDVGGSAVYTDAFNTANAYVHSTRQHNNWENLGDDGFFDVIYDKKLSGRLGRPQTLVAEGNNLVQGGAIWPREVDDATWAKLGYDAPLDRGGHRNQRGLTAAGGQLLRDLAKEGVLIDVAHMSQNSTAGALLFATINKYPVMDSHTGLRDADETAANERALMREHARIIADLGGVIGLGTEGSAGQQPIVVQPVMPQNEALVRFTGKLPTRQWGVSTLPGNPAVSHLTVTIKTGDDDLRGGRNWVKARVLVKGQPLTFELSKGAKWDNGSTHTVTFALPAGTRANDIGSFGLDTNPNGKNGDFDDPDNWNVDTLRVDATLVGVDPVGAWLQGYQDVLELMKGRGVAFGTDMNGFAPQVPFAADAVRYPLAVAASVGTPPAGYTPPRLPPSRLGNRAFDFRRDGLAHYGMLPDFLQALSQKTNSRASLAALFRSANDVVVMWEACESQKTRIR